MVKIVIIYTSNLSEQPGYMIINIATNILNQNVTKVGI